MRISSHGATPLAHVALNVLVIALCTAIATAQPSNGSVVVLFPSSPSNVDANGNFVNRNGSTIPPQAVDNARNQFTGAQDNNSIAAGLQMPTPGSSGSQQPTTGAPSVSGPSQPQVGGTPQASPSGSQNGAGAPSGTPVTTSAVGTSPTSAQTVGNPGFNPDGSSSNTATTGPAQPTGPSSATSLPVGSPNSAAPAVGAQGGLTPPATSTGQPQSSSPQAVDENGTAAPTVAAAGTGSTLPSPEGRSRGGSAPNGVPGAVVPSGQTIPTNLPDATQSLAPSTTTGPPISTTNSLQSSIAGVAVPAGAAAAAVGLFGSRRAPTVVVNSPADAQGSVVTRFPLEITQPETNQNYSENLDNCVKSLAANKTGTRTGDWYLVGDEFNASRNAYDVTYDAQYAAKDDEQIKKDMKGYISSGGMSRDIETNCGENGVNVTLLSEPSTRSTNAASGKRHGLRGGRLAGLIIGVILAALLLCCLLPLLFLCLRRRRQGASDSEDEDYSREQFSTRRNPDLEAGSKMPDIDRHGRDTSRAGHYARDAGMADAGAATAATAAAGSTAADSIAASSFTDSTMRAGSPLPYRDVDGNFSMDPTRDEVVRSAHPHDYQIGAGPVTTSTPIPPRDYVQDGSQETSLPQAGLPQAPVGPGSIRDSTSEHYRDMIDGLRDRQ